MSAKLGRITRALHTMSRELTMNIHEERFWKALIELGARAFMLGDKHALDLRPIRITNARKLGLFCQAIVEVVGHSNANRRHVDRGGHPVFVVTDYYTLDQTSMPGIRVAEDRARLQRTSRKP